MTTLTVTIGLINFSLYVIQADIWRESLNGIGRFELILDPYPNVWLGLFSVDQVVTITIDGVLMMEGYIDDIRPFLAEGGTFTVLYRIQGRDYGMDLAQLYISAEYENTPADDIVQNALLASGGEIAYTSASVAANIDYVFDRTFLMDGIQDVAQNIGADFYVRNTKVAGNAILRFFQAGAPIEHTGVDLVCDANSLTNNILWFDMGEQEGFNLKNRVECIAGKLRDHWTELNGADYTPNATTACGDETTVFLFGQGSIEFRKTFLAGIIEGNLVFPRYSHTILDLSERDQGRYRAYPYYSTGALVNKAVKIELTDNAGNIIEFYRGAFGGPTWHNCTDAFRNAEWREIHFMYGDGVEINPAGSNTNDTWQYVGAAVAFDWSNVAQIGFHSNGSGGPLAVNDRFFIDGLDLPTVEVRSVATDPTPIGGTRMIPYYQPEITSQMELDALATWRLERLQDPAETIEIMAIGQTGSLYAAQSLDVRIAGYVPALTKYRIHELHHQVVKSSEESMEPGYTFITEYTLVRHTISSGTQKVIPERLEFLKSPVKSKIKSQRKQFDAIQRSNYNLP